VRLGVPICEDIWREDVVECLAETGAEILLVPNGSPYWGDKDEIRLNLRSRASPSTFAADLPQSGRRQDELVFDGASFALHADRSVGIQLPAFRETVVTVHWERRAIPGAASTGRWNCWRIVINRITPPAFSGCAIMSTRTAFKA
jgi:NAD+ synthase